MVLQAAATAMAAGLDSGAFTLLLKPLVDLEIDSHLQHKPSQLVSRQLVRYVGVLYENGWQPADLVHSVRRRWTVRAAKLMTSVIAVEAAASRAAERAPQAWLEQLSALGALDFGQKTIKDDVPVDRPVYGPVDLRIDQPADFFGDPQVGRRVTTSADGGVKNDVRRREAVVATWARQETLYADELLTISLGVLGQLMRSPKLSLLLIAPSKWGDSNKGVRPPAAMKSAAVDPKTLTLIRALLAKAEGTNFEAEAEAFTAKAQDMMTRCSIDAAFVAASADRQGLAAGIESRRIHIDSPYADEKATFLAVVADVNTVRAIWSPDIGFSTLMGFPVDLDLTELLFTSLLVQATRASAEATSVDRRLRTASFRRAFLVAFAGRIGERLRDAGQHASAEAQEHYGGALVPLLAAKADAVDGAYEHAFPDTQPMKRRNVDARGWHAGRAAADRAHIKTGEAIGRPN